MTQFIIKNKIYFIALSILTIMFQINYGLGVILPGSTNWIMSAYQDWGQHYLGWAYFREEPWTFPLGQVNNFNYPAGTTVGYTDSIPLMAIIFKSISFLLPETFQYLGLWLFICHLLTGFFTIKIAKLYNASDIVAIIAALLVAFNPVLLYRGMHPALCSHWLILGSIYFYLINANIFTFKSILRKQFILVVLSAVINPYMLFIVLFFSIILLAKYYFFNKLISIKEFSFYLLLNIVSVLFLWFITGMISFNNDVNMEVTNSYGLYGFNLNSFYNPETFSNILPQQEKVSTQQYEGFAYLGLGLILLFIISIMFFLWNFKKFNSGKIFLPFFILVIFFTLFATTNTVSFNKEVLFTYYLPSILYKIGSIFRASGRFIWVLYYAIIIFSLIIVIKSNFSKLIKASFLFLIMIIQFYDISQMIKPRNLQIGEYANEKLQEDKWVDLTSNFKKIITYVPFNNNLLYKSDYQDLCFMALKNNLPITCGYVARESTAINQKFTDSLNLKITEGEVSEDDIFITTPQNLDFFNSIIFKEKVEVKMLDGYYVLYSKKTKIKNQLEQTDIDNKKTDSIFNKIKADLKLNEISRPNLNSKTINCNVDKNVFSNNVLQLQGWGFLKNGHSEKDSIFVALIGDKKTYLVKTKLIKRPDLITHFNNKSLENTGFSVNCFTEFAELGNYEIAIGIKNKNGVISYQSLNQPTLVIRKETKPQIIKKLPPINSSVIFNIEKTNNSVSDCYIDGWAAIKNIGSSNNIVYLTLQNGKNIYQIETNALLRKDVTSHFKNVDGKNYDNAGFSAIIKFKDLPKGKYSVGILIVNNNKEQLFSTTDKTIVIN